VPVVIPELVFVVGLFFAVVGYLVARGILATWTHSIGYLLEALASALVLSVSLGFKTVHIDFSGPVRSLDNFVVKALQNWSAGAEIEMAYCLHGMTKVAQYTAQAVDYLARESAATFDWLVGIHLPKLTRNIVAPAALGALIAKMVADAIRKALPRVDHVAHAVAHAATVPITRTVTIPHLGELQWIHRHWKALTAALATAGTVTLAPGLAIPRVWHGIDELRAKLGRIEKRLTKTEALFGATALAAAMANVLGIPNPRCLRKGPLGRVARHLCGLPTHFLNDLLGLLADFFILENVCTVLPWIETAASDIGTPLVEVLTEVGAGLCRGSQAPGALRGPAPSIPALIFGVSASGV
jgi:hypothetical protein